MYGLTLTLIEWKIYCRFIVAWPLLRARARNRDVKMTWTPIARVTKRRRDCSSRTRPDFCLARAEQFAGNSWKRMKRMDTLEIKLSKQVRLYRHLYDPASREHRDVVKAQKSWREIAETMGKDEATCRKIWKNLRDRFVKTKKRSKKRGGSASTRTAPLLTELAWLTEFVKHRETDSNIPSEDAESESLLSHSMPKAAVSTQTDPALLPSEVKAERVMSQRTDDGSSPEQSPAHSPDRHSAGHSVGPPPSPHHSSPSCSSSATSPAPPERPPASSPSNAVPPPSDPEPSVDATTFWKSCNTAGCTQAIFTGFINEMNDISSRIQSGQASQEDYDLALTVMSASGKLAELVAKQQEELHRKQMEIQEAAAAMEVVASVLK